MRSAAQIGRASGRGDSDRSPWRVACRRGVSRPNRAHPTHARVRGEVRVTPGEKNPLAELARLLPDALDEDALRDLASRLLPYLETPDVGEQHNRLLTAADAAERVGVNVETVRRAIRAGDLTVAARIGRSPRITMVALETWLADTSRNAEGATTPRYRRPRRVNRPAENSLRAAFES